ncbi:hypothetical protein BELL_1247g00020 [Botrytis elliptica]|uniref:Uncharacterized protein n=1 Tax=Botrytis elliptica TaxID=278938 RepID=A0A4Z1IDA8_9HELO|nr:hypothetical protein BELL_1247g00020 [Botrytis elliptica]
MYSIPSLVDISSRLCTFPASIEYIQVGPKVSLTIRSSICNVHSAKDVRDAFSVIQVTTIKLNPSPPGTAEMENIKRPKRPKC